MSWSAWKISQVSSTCTSGPDSLPIGCLLVSRQVTLAHSRACTPIVWAKGCAFSSALTNVRTPLSPLTALSLERLAAKTVVLCSLSPGCISHSLLWCDSGLTYSHASPKTFLPSKGMRWAVQLAYPSGVWLGTLQMPTGEDMAGFYAQLILRCTLCVFPFFLTLRLLTKGSSAVLLGSLLTWDCKDVTLDSLSLYCTQAAMLLGDWNLSFLITNACLSLLESKHPVERDKNSLKFQIYVFSLQTISFLLRQLTSQLVLPCILPVRASTCRASSMDDATLKEDGDPLGTQTCYHLHMANGITLH